MTTKMTTACALGLLVLPPSLLVLVLCLFLVAGLLGPSL